MDLSRAAIVEGLRRIVEPGDVITDEKILIQSSVDNFRKLQNIFDVHTMPVPAAVFPRDWFSKVTIPAKTGGFHIVNFMRLCAVSPMC